MKNIFQHSYYLYLNSLYQKEEGYNSEMNWQVDRIYREYGEDWRVAWLLLFMSEEYNKDQLAKWTFLKEQFVNGCRSPLIYLEALLLLNQNPTLLRKLDAFEMQVLYYGKKQDKVGLELLEQVVRNGILQTTKKLVIKITTKEKLKKRKLTKINN